MREAAIGVSCKDMRSGLSACEWSEAREVREVREAWEALEAWEAWEALEALEALVRTDEAVGAIVAFSRSASMLFSSCISASRFALS